MQRLALAATWAASLLALTGCLDGTIFDDGSATDPRDYLRDTQYTKWVIEVDAVQGMMPDEASLEFMRGRVAAVVNKPDGVEVRVDDTGLQGQAVWTQGAIEDAFRNSLDTKTKGRTIVTHILFLDGEYKADDEGEAGDSTQLGVATDYDKVAIFSADLRAACQPIGLPPCPYTHREVFDAVLVHEMGHALGLVNRHGYKPNGDPAPAPVPMQRDHEDEAHPQHSDNPQSVMYYAVESDNFVQALTGGLPNQFDVDDRADLRAAGGR